MGDAFGDLGDRAVQVGGEFAAVTAALADRVGDLIGRLLRDAVGSRRRLQVRAVLADQDRAEDGETIVKARSRKTESRSSGFSTRSS